MIADVFTAWRTHLRERLSNPLLGPFTALWLTWNWRLVSVLFFSSAKIEDRIRYIDNNYINEWDLLVIPLAGALVFALTLPWVSLFIQSIQESPNIRREKSRLRNDTRILHESVAKAEAQANLNRILAQDEITRRLQTEMGSLKEELAKQKEIADSRVTAAEAALDQKVKEYEAESHKSDKDALAEKKELEQLRKVLETEQTRARLEVEQKRNELDKKQKELDSRLKTSGHPPSSVTDSELEQLLTKLVWLLFHNPKIGPDRSKKIVFGKSGEIQAGKNDNEHKWQVQNGMLELLQADGKVHSRFNFLPESRIFVHSGDVDTPSARGQYIVPKPSEQ